MEGWDEACLHNLLECPGAQGQVSLIGNLGGAVAADSHEAMVRKVQIRALSASVVA